ncbi:MAG: hypothetical protein K1X64_13260 [Myxococcaceae bacterium]|nr:hypothetical protein [Myxococcaceae bacterium]
MVMADDRWCADTSPSTANDLANETPRLPKESVEKVAPGAWVIHTKKGSPVSASTVLASAAFLRSLGPASLVALAPTDGAIALADASSPASIRVAATRLKPLIDTSLDDGVLQSAPLLFADGQWKPWNGRFPSEVAEVVKLGEFIETRMALDILKDFPTEEDATAMSLVGAPDPPTDFKGGTPTTVDIDPKGRTTVHVDLSLHEDLLVGQADLVEIEDDRGTKTLGWKTFTQKYSKQLEAVMLNGTKVPRVQRLLATASGS